MIKSEYYQNYKGPNLVKATLDNVDIMDQIKNFYGEQNDWNQKLWTYNEVFGEAKGQFHIEFVSEDGRRHWFYGQVGKKDQYFNPPLSTPMNQA
jgi:hypothetical protein